MNFELPAIYPITDTRLADLSHTEQVKRLIEGGAEIIQLREKSLSPNDFYEDAKRAIEIARAENVKLIINDRVDIALVLEADGVHLGQNDVLPEHARKILGKNAIIGFSTHNLAQAIKALEFPIDYIAIGPVFTTITKENPDATVGIEGVSNVREAIGEVPLVAIGGITLDNCREVFEAGADSVAVIGNLVSDRGKITEKMRSFINSAQTQVKLR